MRRRSHAGFTLVELLVALFAMALLAVLSWRGLDGMTRAQSITSARADEVLTLQVGLQQWAADLDAVTVIPGLNPVDWNGRVLRITRASKSAPTDGVLVAAWTTRIVNGNTVWLRWQSPQAFTRGDLGEAWAKADLWSQNPSSDLTAREVAVAPIVDWQLFFFRENAWTNPQSSAAMTASANAAATAAVQKLAATTASPALSPASIAANSATALAALTTTYSLPDGVRLVLTLPEGQAISGVLTRDWVKPTLGRGQP